jgi:hypothetical protein
MIKSFIDSNLILIKKIKYMILLFLQEEQRGEKEIEK